MPIKVPKIEREGLAAKVASILRTGIIEGKFAPNERLPENWLSEQLGVSRAPIREALRILEIEGLVRINLQKGARVRELTAKDIESIYDVRSNLDSLAVRLAIANLRAKDLSQLEAMLSQMKFAVEEEDLTRYRELNGEFHRFFFQKSANEWLCNMNNSLMNHIMRLRSFSLSTSARLAQSFQEHLCIMGAVRQKNPEKAEALAKQHTLAAGKLVLQMFLKNEHN
jgi:DNA-binding GntR family transcriptional regulator